MTKDLVVLAADIQQEKTIETLLRDRHAALGIRAVTFDIFRHPRKDSGVYHEAHDFLRPYQQIYNRALVLLDCEWSGSPGDSMMLQIQIGERSSRVAGHPIDTQCSWSIPN